MSRGGVTALIVWAVLASVLYGAARYNLEGANAEVRAAREIITTLARERDSARADVARLTVVAASRPAAPSQAAPVPVAASAAAQAWQTCLDAVNTPRFRVSCAPILPDLIRLAALLF